MFWTMTSINLGDSRQQMTRRVGASMELTHNNLPDNSGRGGTHQLVSAVVMAAGSVQREQAAVAVGHIQLF